MPNSNSVLVFLASQKTYELEALMFRLRQYKMQITPDEDDIRKTEIITNKALQSCGENEIKKESEFVTIEKNNESSHLNKR